VGFRATWLDPAESRAVRLVRGPQADLFPRESHLALEENDYRVSPTSDRMGSRLDGPALSILAEATLPSEGTCLGAIQVPDGGQPIVLLRDGPTVGGYPKIGAVISADLARFAQVPLGETVRFEWVSLADAHTAMYEARERLDRTVTAIPAGG
jgi:allophanate hydrolase subunit 2